MNFDSIYNINFDRLIVLLLPMRKRKPRIINLLMCLASPIKEIHSRFVGYRETAIYRVSHTAQVFSMENVINDAFDRTQRRIYILDGEYVYPVYFYDRAINRPVRFSDRASAAPIRFNDRSSLEKIEVDFSVVLPSSLRLDEAETTRLRALIDFYRLPDKTYTIAYE
ncbi:hypothetical protein [Spongiimicrobium salis]|uniref:hypothetical protein n=1 Tax=Spongiimicrobium salis TaxID=1667022 RepID=UPI00374DD429